MILLVTCAAWLAGFAVLLRIPRTARPEWLCDWLAIGLVGAGTAGFFWRLLFTGDVWMPAGGGDLAGFLYPTYSFAAEWWQRGVFPLWNPYLFAGQPFVGDIQSGIFYPINLLSFLISRPLAYRDLELLAILHYFLAGAGMYALLRWGPLTGERPSLSEKPGLSLGLSRLPAFAGAMAFEFSDLFITHFGNLNLIASAAWLPLVFLFFARAFPPTPKSSGSLSGWIRSPGLGSAAIAGILLALSFLAGHIQAFLFVLMAIGLYTIFLAFTQRAKAMQAFVLLLFTVAVGLGLSALVLVPGIEMARASVRSAFTYENTAAYSLPPAELVGLFVPGFFGRGPQAAWGPWDRVEVGYIGILPLFLAGLALAVRRDRTAWFFGFLAVVGLAVALGGYSILHGWLYAFAPGLGQLRAPARFIYVLDFGLAVLAAMGLDLLMQPLAEKGERMLARIMHVAPWAALIVAAAGGALALGMLALGQGQDPALFQRIARSANAIFFAIFLMVLSLALVYARQRNRISANLCGVLAVVLICFDLYSLGANVDVGVDDPTAKYNRDDIAEFLSRDADLFRIDSRGTGIDGAWLPDTALLYHLQDVNGDNPLVLSSFERYWQTLGGRDSLMYRRLNVKYVLARPGAAMPPNFRRVFDGKSGVSVWENSSWLPRAGVVYNTTIVNSAAEAQDLLEYDAGHNNNLNPAAGVVLLKGAAPLPGSSQMGEAAEIAGYGPNEIDVQADNGPAGYLVLSEVYYPGWRAFVNGIETPVLQANAIFRAVALPPGPNTIRMIYDPISFKLGWLISALTAAALVAFVILRRNTRA